MSDLIVPAQQGQQHLGLSHEQGHTQADVGPSTVEGQGGTHTITVKFMQKTGFAPLP